MNSKFKVFKLGNVATIFAGGDKPQAFSEAKNDAFKIPVYANGETNEGLQGYTTKAKVKEPAVTVSARGTIGYAVLRKEPFVPIVRLLTLIPNKDLLDIGFLYYYLRLYRQKGIGSSQAQLIAPELSKRTISIPLLPTQKSIAKVLSDLDAKIELNNKINRELEAMAKTLYDYWFVQFDFPVRTLSGVEGYKSSGGKMVYNPELKREIPEGWEVKKLGEMIRPLESGKRPKGGIDKNLKAGIPSLGAESIDTLGYFNYKNTKYIPFSYKEKITSGIVQNNDILIYKDGAYVGKTTLFRDNFPFEYTTINEHVFLLRGLKSYFQEYLFFTLNLESYFNLMQTLGLKAAQPGLNQTDLKSLLIVSPNEREIIRFNEIVESYFKIIFNNSKQNQQLSELRDWLLPMLMNGQVVSTGSTTRLPVTELVEGMAAEPSVAYKKG